jgi:hypothetical protein
MKKIIILLSLSSCTLTNDISKIKTIKNCEKNIRTLQYWLNDDYQSGLIPYHVAQNYTYILEVTENDLKKIKDKQYEDN